MNGRPLAPVTGGLVEGAIPGEQPVGTYSHGRNVRGIDPRTGKYAWAAQRAGLTQEGETLTSYAKRLFSASKLRPARQFVSLSTTADETIEPSEVGVAWTTDIDDFAIDVSTGIDGQGHFLLRSGDVVIVNRKGREVERIPSAAPIGFEPVPRVFAGEDGAVYTAYTRDLPFKDEDTGDEGAGRIVRWVKQEDGVWTQAWSAVIPERISTFAFRDQFLWWAEDPRREVDEANLPAAVGRISAPLVGPEWTMRQTVAARPIFDIAIAESGAAFVSSPENLGRGVRDAIAYTQRNVGWTPPELAAWQFNSWTWLERSYIDDSGLQPQNEQEVEVLRDKRFEPTDFAPVSDEEPERQAIAREAQGIFSAPTWDDAAFGGFGGLVFNESTQLHSGANADIDDRLQSLAFIPGTEDDWTIYMVVEFTENQMAATGENRQLLSQRSEDAAQGSWRLYANGPDIYFEDMNTGAALAGPVTIQSTSRTAVIAVSHRGAGDFIDLWVNGEHDVSGAASTTPKQGGEHFFTGFTDATEDGPKGTLGGGRYNQMNLLRGADSDIRNEPLFGNDAPGRIFDGDADTSIKFRSQRFRLHTDFNASVPTFDTLVLNFRMAVSRSPEIRIRTAPTRLELDSAPTDQRTFTVNRTGDRNYHVELNLADDDGTAFVPNTWLEIQITSDENTSDTEFRIRDVSVRDYGTDTTPSAEFTLGEFIAVNRPNSIESTTPGAGSEHQEFEGYLAHKYGIGHELRNEAGTLGSHPYSNAGNFPGGTGGTQIDAEVLGRISGPDPVLVKYTLAGDPVAAFSGAGVGLGAAVDGRKVYTIGDPTNDASTDSLGALINRFRDRGRRLEYEDSIAAGSDEPFQRPTQIAVGPGSSLLVPFEPKPGTIGNKEIRRYDGAAMTLDWEFTLPGDGSGLPARATGLDVAGRQVDEALIGGDQGPEFLYVSRENLDGGAERLDVMGLRDNGVREGRDIAKLAVLEGGDVVRLDGETWTTLEPGALPGDIIGAATLTNRTILSDGRGYRVYDHNLQQLRDFEEAARGDFPPRCKLIAAYRGRLVLARGDEAFTVYQSAIGDPFNFDYGPEVTSIGQAIAGTTASNGQAPEPITALIPYRDDLLFIGTEESLFVLTGDLADGGRLDQIDKSQGVAFGYAWCESPRGIYYFSGRGGVFFISPQGGLQLMTEGQVQRRMEEIDLDSARVELAYNWIDKAVHVYVIPHALGGDVEHFVYEERTGAWHIDTYGVGFDRAVTTASSLIGDTPEDRTLVVATGDGRVLRWDQYAEDDAGQAVASELTIGPIASEREGAEVNVSGVYPVLASDQGGMQVGVRASNTPDAPGPPGDFQDLDPGRPLGVPLNVTAPNVWLTFRGLGRAWAAHAMRADVRARGRARRI